VEEAAHSTLAAWEAFYVIVGSSAAALTGLQFVVIALIAESQIRSTSGQIAAFGTPTVVHFCAVLLVSAIQSAPWRSFLHPALAIGAVAIAGVVYVLVVIRRARRQTGYEPVLEDWVWHAVLPLTAHVVLLIAAFRLLHDPVSALFAIGAAAVLLLFIGIHNAWDTVTYIAIDRRARPEEPGEAGPVSGGG
jgi:hypothetical protein